MKNIFIFGYYGFDNLGDEAILLSIIKQIKNSREKFELTALVKEDANAKAKYGINTVSRKSIFRIIDIIKKSDIIISGGGSILQDVTSSRSLMYYLAIILISKMLNKKVMFYANGFGPINKAHNRMIATCIINKVDVIAVRDYKSKELMQSMGIKNNILVTADATFAMELLKENEAKNLIEEVAFDENKKAIGISVRQWKNLKNYKETVAKMGDYLSKLNYQIVFIPMQHPSDVEISKEISAMMENESVVLEKKYAPNELISIMGNLEMLIGMRLHSLIFAAISGVPMVGIEYDPKIKSFLDDFEQLSAGDVESLEFISFCTVVENTLHHRDEIIEKLSDKKRNMKAKVANNFNLLVQLAQDG
ncbi:MAG: polysaccharide pyruvyl transferase CsaB [Alkaliphilus sp.]|nr:polysaccharide pyruvyl transferase CsaB [bacterium AH-315-G05]PHS35953.1 MAG: polysaccharide pyruvyl transferase CsaB [Alkaliphilus sp.]